MSTFEYKQGREPPLQTSSSLASGYTDSSTRASNGRQHGGYVNPPQAGSAGYSPAERRTLAQMIGDGFGRVLGGLLHGSSTIARVDLRRPLRYKQPLYQADPNYDPYGTSGPVMESRPGPPEYDAKGYPIDSRGQRGHRGYDDRAPSAPPMPRGRRGISWNSPTLHGGGARLKLMQIWNVEKPLTGDSVIPLNMNFGFGANFDMDTSRLTPRLRMRADHVSIHLLPEPAVELRGKYRIFETNLAVDLRYMCPVRNAQRFWESPARLQVRLFHPFGTGFHLTPGGLEFDEHALKLGESARLRVAAAVDFPKQFPLEEGEPPIQIRVSRLGLKAKIL